LAGKSAPPSSPPTHPICFKPLNASSLLLLPLLLLLLFLLSLVLPLLLLLLIILLLPGLLPGKRRLEPLGVIVFASIMSVTALQIVRKACQRYDSIVEESLGVIVSPVVVVGCSISCCPLVKYTLSGLLKERTE